MATVDIILNIYSINDRIRQKQANKNNILEGKKKQVTTYRPRKGAWSGGGTC